MAQPKDTAGPAESKPTENATCIACGKAHELPPETMAGFKEVVINLKNTLQLAKQWARSKGLSDTCIEMALRDILYSD